MLGYARYPFRDFESFFRFVVDLDEDDIQLILKQYNCFFVTYEISPGVYTNKDISAAVYTLSDPKRTLQKKYDDISIETKLILTLFGSAFGTLGFDEKSFLKVQLVLPRFWDYKPTNAIHADSPGVYTSSKNLYLSTIDKIHLKCDVFDGSVVNGIRQPILFSFILDEPAGYKVFCQPETIHY